jgi:hypothetical protein
LDIIESLKGLLHSQQLKEQCRNNDKDFTRRRILTFPILVVVLMNMLTKTLQVELTRFFKVLKGQRSDVQVSTQAFSQARQKLSETVFIQLDERLVDEFYTDNTYTTWKGYRLIGIDGSTSQLPESEEIRQEFGSASNQHGAAMPMARISVAYDVVNGLGIESVIAPYSSEERDLALQHLTRIEAFDRRTEGRRGHGGDVFLFDMGYPALYFIALFILAGKEVVIRTSDAFLQEVHEAIQSGIPDQIIQVPIKTPTRRLHPKLKALKPDLDPTWVISLRVVVLTLEDGRVEYLVTTLLDAERFPYEVFQGVYAQRWGSETQYDVLKNMMELENFTGKSALSVRQDFYATVLTKNIQGLIQWELSEEIAADNQHSSRTYAYALNTNVSIGLLKDTLVTLLMTGGDLQSFYQQVKHQMKRNLVPIRPNRHFPRTRTSRRKYAMTKRRAL